MEYGSCQRTVNVGIAEGFQEVFHGARATGGNQRDVANFTHFFQLLEVVTVTHAVLIHHVEDDFSGAAFLHLLYPVERFPLSDAGAAFIAGILIHMIFTGFGVVPGINTDHNTLHAKAIRQASN